MGRAKRGELADTKRDEGPASGLQATAARAEPLEASGLVAASLEAFDAETGAVTLRVLGVSVDAALDPSVSPVVVKTALERGERVIAQREEAGWVVLGTLRTTPTPGVDVGDEYVIEARRVSIQAEHSFKIVSGASSLVIRALGAVEILSDTITARAAHAAKIIGRVIRLN